MRVNIIVPNFNKKKYLKHCLESVVGQVYGDLKLICIDNESTDGSAEEAEKILSKFKGTNLYGMPLDYVIDSVENIYPQCWDECLEKAYKYLDSEWYTILGSDDFISPEYIYKFVEYMHDNAKNNILSIQSDLVWFKTKSPKSHDYEILQVNRHVYNNIDELKVKMLSGCAVNSPSVFYHTDILNNKNLKRNPEEYSGAADYDFYCQMLDKNIYIENANTCFGYYYRVNPEQATWQMHKNPIPYDTLIQNKWKEKWKKY